MILGHVVRVWCDEAMLLLPSQSYIYIYIYLYTYISLLITCVLFLLYHSNENILLFNEFDFALIVNVRVEVMCIYTL